MFELKFIINIFSKNLLCKVSIFFIHHLGCRNVSQKEKKNVGVAIKKKQ
jgi:hypothetical protein